MSVFVKAISELVALFLQALRFSYILPAIIFVGLNLAFILPDVAPSYQQVLSETDGLLFLFTLALCSVVLLVAYALTILNLPIIRFFEGYALPAIPFVGERLRLSHYRRVLYLQRQIEKFEQAAEEYTKRGDTGRAALCQARRNAFNTELIWLYPHHQLWRILPTRLGNVIAAAEEYPEQLFGIDSVTFWPFLVPILEEEKYASFIEKEKALLDFPLNLAVVSLVFGAEAIYFDILLQNWDWVLSPAKLLIAVVLAFCFYLLSIQGAISWGYTIRTAFVLYRKHLRQKLGLIPVQDYYGERVLWKRASRFYRDHDPTPAQYIFAPGEVSPQTKGEG